MKILEASAEHVPEVARLFDLYRQFYQCEPDLALARDFIGARIRKRESTIFIAVNDNDRLSGFTQLYPSFCSVDAIRIYILYDLYVDSDSRNLGIGKRLMDRAADFAREQGAMRIDLMTAFSNKAGQHLYEKLGYRREMESFHSYSLRL